MATSQPSSSENRQKWNIVSMSGMEKITILGYGASLVVCLFRPGQKMDTWQMVGWRFSTECKSRKKKFYYGFNIICKQITSIFFFSQSLFIMLIFSSCQDVLGHYKPYTFIKTTTSKRKLRMICKIEFIIFRRMMNLTSFHVVCVSHTFKI